MRVNPGALILMLVLLLVPAFPYGLQYAPGSREPLRWNADRITLTISESLLPKDAVRSDVEIADIVQRAAAVWTSAGGPQFEIRYSPETSVSAAGQAGDGLSLLTIAATPDNLMLFAGSGSPKPAVTRLFYDRDGTITEADVVLNPYFSHTTNGLPGSFDLESTLVHEFGHLLGLGHSSLPGASMFEFNGRNGLYGLPFSIFRSLSADDRAGIRTLYGAGSESTDCCASVEGVVPVPGRSNGSALVWGENAQTGAVEGSVLADGEGRYRLSGFSNVPLRVFVRNEASGGIGDLGTFYDEGWLASEEPKSDKAEGKRMRLLGVGVNGELSGLAVPLVAGNTYRVYAAVTEFSGSTIFRVSSPLIEVDDRSYEVFDYGEGITVVSFLVSVEAKVSNGMYSLRVQHGMNVADSLPGVISIGSEDNQFVHHLTVNKPDLKGKN